MSRALRNARYTFVANGITSGYSFFVRSADGTALSSAYSVSGGAISGSSGSFSFIVPLTSSETTLAYYSPGSVRAALVDKAHRCVAL